MKKTISIQYLDYELLEPIVSALFEEEYVETIIHKAEEKIIDITFNESKGNKYGLSFYSILTIPLLLDYIYFHSKYKNKEKEKAILIHKILEDSYFSNVLLIELINYFKSMTLLKEKIFFQFNMKGLEEEFDYIIEEEALQSLIENGINELKEELKRNKVNFKDFSELELCFDKNKNFALKNKKGVLLTPNNTLDVLKVEIMLPELDDELIELVTFCVVVLPILEVQKLLVPSGECEIIKALSEQDIFIENKLKLVLI